MIVGKALLRVRVVCSVGVMFVAGLNGCGGGKTEPKLPTLVGVSGVIKIDGQPLTDASVTFIPDGGSGMGQGSFGTTDSNGSYELKTSVASKKMNRGAIPGNYRVQVSRFAKSDGTVIPPNSTVAPANVGAAESIPVRFSDMAMTVLRANVPAEGGTFDFEVTSK